MFVAAKSCVACQMCCCGIIMKPAVNGFLNKSPHDMTTPRFLCSSPRISSSLRTENSRAPVWAGYPSQGAMPMPATSTRRPNSPFDRCQAKSTAIPLPVPRPSQTLWRRPPGIVPYQMLVAKVRSAVCSVQAHIVGMAIDCFRDITFQSWQRKTLVYWASSAPSGRARSSPDTGGCVRGAALPPG